MARINIAEGLGLVKGLITGLKGERLATQMADERDLAGRVTLDQAEWGDVLKPDQATINRAIEATSSSRGRNAGRDRDLSNQFYEASTAYTTQQAHGGEGSGFDQQAWAEMVEWARVNDPGLWQDMTGGEGQSVLRGYDTSGQARGVDPNSLAPEALAAHLEAGTFPNLPFNPTTEQMQRALMDFDWPRNVEMWERQGAATENFALSNEALYSRDGGAAFADADAFQVAGLRDAEQIRLDVEGDVTEGRRRIDIGRQNLRDVGETGLADHEGRRTRGLTEFQDDTANRIEQQRTGLNANYKSSINQMMSEMQAQGMSQREITAAVREQSFSHRTAISEIVGKHNIEVARERSALGLSYDTLTSEFQRVNLAETGAFERAAVGAESTFTTLLAQASEATAINSIMVERDTVAFRSQADAAYMSNQVVFGDMLNRLAATMPQAAEYMGAAWGMQVAEDALRYGYDTDSLAFSVDMADRLSALGDNLRQQNIADTQAAATQDAASSAGTSSMIGAGAQAFGTILGGPIGGAVAGAGADAATS